MVLSTVGAAGGEGRGDVSIGSGGGSGGGGGNISDGTIICHCHRRHTDKSLGTPLALICTHGIVIGTVALP